MKQRGENMVGMTASDIRAGRDRHGSATDWERVDTMTEAEVEHNAVDDQLENGFVDSTGPIWAGLPPPFGTGKKLMSVRIDNDVVEWFKSQGKGYQTRMNAVLRSYMNAHRR